ncbi:MAG: hypothetical protein AAFP69_17170, partial [Planctomycetota bacterium]
RQKRQLAKAAALLDEIRSQEVRSVLRSPEGEIFEVTKKTYVDSPPEVIARKVLGIASEVVAQHGARQKANSANTGRFEWMGIDVELTVPQLRAPQDVHGVISEMIHRLPRRNPRCVPNQEIDGRPAFARKPSQQFETETKYVPYEEDNTTRVRTYAEEHRVLVATTQEIEIDFGIEVDVLNDLKEMVGDLKTAIQVAIDLANAKGHEADTVLEDVIGKITQQLQSQLP